MHSRIQYCFVIAYNVIQTTRLSQNALTLNRFRKQAVLIIEITRLFIVKIIFGGTQSSAE